MIEATWGLGEGLVQGLVNPDNYLIQKETGIFDFRYVPEKDLMVVRKTKAAVWKPSMSRKHLYQHRC